MKIINMKSFTFNIAIFCNNHELYYYYETLNYV